MIKTEVQTGRRAVILDIARLTEKVPMLGPRLRVVVGKR